MIYVDTSVVLAELLSEDRRPPEWLWNETLVSSRLIEYEVWTRLHTRGLAGTHGEAAGELTGRISLLEMQPPVLARAMEPFPIAVRTLDALHLASLEHLRSRVSTVKLASYDRRMVAAARALGTPIVELPASPAS